MLMAGSAALIISLGVPLIGSLYQQFGSGVRADPGSLVQAIVIGVSFLGSGTIIRHRDQGQVEGLTTAATLLFVAVIGIAVAPGQELLAIGATLLVLITLRGIRWLERRQSA